MTPRRPGWLGGLLALTLAASAWLVLRGDDEPVAEARRIDRVAAGRWTAAPAGPGVSIGPGAGNPPGRDAGVALDTAGRSAGPVVAATPSTGGRATALPSARAASAAGPDWPPRVQRGDVATATDGAGVIHPASGSDTAGATRAAPASDRAGLTGAGASTDTFVVPGNDWPPLTAAARAAWAPRQVAAAAPQPAVDTGTAPAGAAAPPRFPYTLIGRWEAAVEPPDPARAARPLLLLSGPQRTYAVGAGDTVGDQWRIERVSATAFTVVFLPLGSRQSVAFEPS